MLMGDEGSELPLERQSSLVLGILKRAVKEDVELILLLEDDLIFNKHLSHNVRAWCPVRLLEPGQHLFASLFNVGVTLDTFVPELAFGSVRSCSVVGSQAFLISHATVAFMATCWGVEPALHIDIKLSRLAARMGPIFYHVPSLVQHVGYKSTWGGPMLAAPDFNAGWKADDRD